MISISLTIQLPFRQNGPHSGNYPPIVVDVVLDVSSTRWHRNQCLYAYGIDHPYYQALELFGACLLDIL